MVLISPERRSTSKHSSPPVGGDRSETWTFITFFHMTEEEDPEVSFTPQEVQAADGCTHHRKKRQEPDRGAGEMRRREEQERGGKEEKEEEEAEPPAFILPLLLSGFPP